MSLVVPVSRPSIAAASSRVSTTGRRAGRLALTTPSAPALNARRPRSRPSPRSQRVVSAPGAAPRACCASSRARV
jgi:hypothetical protein